MSSVRAHVHVQQRHSNQASPPLHSHTSLPLHPTSPGVLHYLNGEYTEAVSYFLRVAENCQEYDEAVREPSIFNLGHAYRKQRDFDSAAHWYRAALAINPRVASTYSALGFTLHLRGDLDQVDLPQAPSTHNTTTSPPHPLHLPTLLSFSLDIRRLSSTTNPSPSSRMIPSRARCCRRH